MFLLIILASASYEPTVNEVQVPILHRDLCNEWLVQLNVTDGMICAGYSEGKLHPLKTISIKCF